MELYHLRSFVAVARASNITKAADILCTTPPSVSNHIRQIEQEMEISLFTRTPKGMQITSQGKVLLEQAVEILQSVQKFKSLAGILKSDVNGRVFLGINAAPAFLKIPDTIETVRVKYPRVKLEIIPSSTGQILKAVKEGKMDCGFAFGPMPEKDIRAVFLSRVELVIALPYCYRDEYRTADPKALAALPWIVPENRCPLFEQVKEFFRNQDILLKNRVFANDDITKETLVRNGAAVCVLEKSEARPFIESRTVVPWTGQVQFESRLWFVSAEGRAEDLLLTTMVSVVRQVWKPDAGETEND